MYKIGILFENREFEHDVYELIKAFYPEAEIHTLYEDDEAEYDLRFRVERENDNYIIKYERAENLPNQETEKKEQLLQKLSQMRQQVRTQNAE